MANIDKKQKRWYSKSTFDSLDKTTIPVGTEIQVSGAIEEGELDSALQTKINGKLTAPATPAVESAVTMLADGTVSTKPLTSITGKSEVYVGTPDPTGGEILWIDPNGTSGGGGSGGGKLYLHHVQISIPNIILSAMSTIYINIYSNNNTKYTKNTIPKTAYSATILSANGNGTIYLELSSTNAYATGAICKTEGSVVAFNSNYTGDSTWDVINDITIEL